ncbi:MAG: L,D-transpeptidase family protein [Alphaproteobacteria bacterium]|nr:L,D-transpeptidase family protein [Alphaproteobacteria bacterium]
MYAVNMQQILSKNGEIYADNIVVEKKQRKMHLMKKGAVLKEYKISLGSNPVGAKQQENDGKTPEGLYYIESHNHKSKFHLSLKISYPNEDDKKWAKKHNVSAGGDIMIHGFPNWVPDFLFNHFHKSDWTRGCIAVTNEQIEEIWKLVKDGTPIKIMP